METSLQNKKSCEKNGERMNYVLRLKWSFVGAVLFSLAANAFAYLNFYPQHDSLNHSFYFAGTWEVSLGRFLLPVIEKIRGNITMPWVIGIFSMLFIGMAVFLITDILKIDNVVFIVLSAGFLSANITVTELTSVFLFVVDTYLFSIFLSCLGVWLVVSDFTKKLHPVIRILLSGCSFFLSFGIYQASCSVALVLFVLIIIRDCMTIKAKLLKNCFLKWVTYVLSLGVGAALYAVFYKLSLRYYNTTAADSGNSISALKELSIGELLGYVKEGYMQFISFFCKDSCVGTMTTYCNIAMIILLLVCMIRYVIVNKLDIINCVIALICVATLPGFSMIISICMGKTSIYFRATYAIFLMYPAALAGISKWNKKCIHYVMIALSAIILLQNIFYSNGAYTVQKVLYDRALSSVTRILDDIESDSEYLIGETPVILIGTLSGNNSYMVGLSSEYSDLTAFYKSSVTYNQTFGSMVHLLGSSINRETDSDIITYYSELEEVQEMETYPKDGYYQMLDGYMIIKLSE